MPYPQLERLKLSGRDFITPREFADLLGRSHIEHLIRTVVKPYLRPVKINKLLYIPIAEVESWLDKNTVKSTSDIADDILRREQGRTANPRIHKNLHPNKTQ